MQTVPWKVELLVKKPVIRVLRISGPIGSHLVEYRGDGVGSESVWVDKTVAARTASIYRMTPRFDFAIGSRAASIQLRTTWWRDLLPPWFARLEAFMVKIDGEAIYVEGDWLATARSISR